MLGGGALRAWLGEALAAVQSRLELLSIEVQEERLRLVSLLFNGVLAALCLGFGLVFLALFLTVLLWDSHRLPVLGGAALCFLVLALWAARRAAQAVQAGSRLFSASLAELGRDRQALARSGNEEPM